MENHRMTIYSIDLKVAATAYVRANSKEEAIQALKDEISDRYGTDIVDFEVSELRLDSEELPDISLSPVMTVWGPWGDWNDMEKAE
jgi:hypothetical protein